jgi:hypothetical protein
MAKALAWEKEARRQRAALGLKPRRANIRVPRRLAGSGTVTPGVGPLSQKEVAMILRISERAVRGIEHRALEKLRQHPGLRELWADFATGAWSEQPEMQESQEAELTPPEVTALFGLARSAEEEQALATLLTWIGCDRCEAARFADRLVSGY